MVAGAASDKQQSPTTTYLIQMVFDTSEGWWLSRADVVDAGLLLYIGCGALATDGPGPTVKIGVGAGTGTGCG